MTKVDITKLEKYFKHYGISKDVTQFKKIIPIIKRAFREDLFEIENIAKRKIQDQLKDEILGKIRTGLLNLSGTFNENLKSASYFDRLSIMPAQTKPIKKMNLATMEIDLRVTIGRSPATPVVLKSPFYLSSRGAGIVSKSCKMAFAYAASNHSGVYDTGGITFPEEYEINSKYGGKLIHQWDVNRLGKNV